MSKFFSNVIENEIKGGLIRKQPMEQARFRMGFSITDHLFMLNQLLRDTAGKYQLDLNHTFISTAFDSPNVLFMLKNLENQGVLYAYIHIIKEMYTDLRTVGKGAWSGTSSIGK